MSDITAVLILAFILAMTGLVGQAWSDPYVQLSGGCVVSPQTSNDHEIEFNEDLADCGALGAIEAGYTLALDVAQLDLGLDLAGLSIDPHGMNGHGRRTADDRRFRSLLVTPGARVSRRIHERLTLFLGAGGGIGLVEGLGGSDLVPAWRAEAGLRIDLAPGLAAAVGYETRGLVGVDLDGHRGSPVFHGPKVGLRAELPSFLGFLTYRSDREPLEAPQP